VGGVYPVGVRDSATEKWGLYEFDISNLTDTDRRARVLMSYDHQPDVQYGRDLWVPAQSNVRSWMFVGPAPPQPFAGRRDLEFLLYDLTGGAERLILPRGEERIRARGVLYRKYEPSTAVLLDEVLPAPEPFGQLPQPEPDEDEIVRHVRTFRAASKLSEYVITEHPGPLPPMAEAFDGIDQFVVASGRIARDPAGLRALRQWLERGGRVWVMLDRVDVEAVAPLLGEALDFQVLDRVHLNDFKIVTQPLGGWAPPPIQEQQEKAVDFVRVLLPPHERIVHTIDGWPVWFTRSVGRGKVVFTTLGSRGWYKKREKNDPSPFVNHPDLPVPLDPLSSIAGELQRPSKDPFPEEAFGPVLTEEIGYAVVGRGTVAAVFAGFVAAAAGLAFVLRKSRRPELVGWLGPAAALAAAAAFVVLGESSRRASPATVAAAQIVDAVSGADEAPVRGLYAVYRPDSGPADYGVGRGGLLEVDTTGVEGQTRRLFLTDVDAWHVENLTLPRGVRGATIEATAPTAAPLRAVGRFGPNGLEGTLTAESFLGLSDAVIKPPIGGSVRSVPIRNLAVRLSPEGAFRAGVADILPLDRFLTGDAVLSDRQQRRQKVYRSLFDPSTSEKKGGGPGGAPIAGLDDRGDGRNVLAVWAQPVDLHVDLVPNARQVGDALLLIPLQLERPAPGGIVTIPGPLIPYRRIDETRVEHPNQSSNADMAQHLRFQLPAEVLPMTVERAELVVKISAPSRTVAIKGLDGNAPIELRQEKSPLDLVRLEVKDSRFLHLDEKGGLHFIVEVRDKSVEDAPVWKIDYLELEVSGRTSGP
jgi:hypothetical protein